MGLCTLGLVRWQSHWHVVRQSLPFFQNDFAGRIANRVMQTANALRESVMSSIRAIFYILVYGISALVLMALSDWRLGVPTFLWFAGYVVFLRYFVPRMRDLGQSSAAVEFISAAPFGGACVNFSAGLAQIEQDIGPRLQFHDDAIQRAQFRLCEHRHQALLPFYGRGHDAGI
ncbi:MAG: ABC transporter ATP-binding protein [Betaproteobacteria bacterium]|nr:ABC transporter ATP-binding protein [Betaproteobacteria bacterium]